MKSDEEYEEYWDIFNKKHLKKVLAARTILRKYTYYVGANGELRFSTPRYDKVGITLSCQGILKPMSHHEFGIYLT